MSPISSYFNPFSSVYGALTGLYKQPSGQQNLDEIAKKASQEYPFTGFSIPEISHFTQAASYDAVPAITSGKMRLTKNVSVNGIGSVSNCYTWLKKPLLEAKVPDNIQNAAVHLPKGLSLATFNQMRKIAQEGVISGNGISPETAQRLALNLRGVTIEAVMPYKAGALLQDGKSDVEVHLIFQTGLNFSGTAGGGIPLTNIPDAAHQIDEFSAETTQAALASAIRNQSDILVFSLGIGTGFFGGSYGNSVKQSNVDGICKAVLNAQKQGSLIEVIVPNIGLTSAQNQQLKCAGIRIVSADKDAVAALCARNGFKVSNTVAGDPMSMLGIHGPGFWWETAGSASDEERAAFLSPSYVLGHIPIDIIKLEEFPHRIAALSEFLIESHY